MSDVFENKGALAATIVVAASNSLNKGQANYVCDGVNDHVEIQAALDALPATGGEVKLLDGTYNCEVSINLDSNQTLRGCGRNTILTTTTADLDIVTATGGAGTEKVGILITDLCVDGAAGGASNDIGILFTYVDYSIIKNTWCLNNGEDGIRLVNSDNNITSDNVCKLNLLDGIYLKTSTYNSITSCVCEANDWCGIELYTSSYNTIAGNQCNQNGWEANIYLRTDSHRNIVMDNMITNHLHEYGLEMTSADYNIISHNLITGNPYYGISMTACNHNTIANNTLTENSQDTTNTYDDIWLFGSDYNNIQGNTCRAGALAKKPKYGINIFNAACDKNLVANNDLYDDGFGTGAFNDTGTLTNVEDNNRGIKINQIKMFRYMKNTSGAQRVAGDVVSLKAVAAGNEVTAPAAVGEREVYGMVAETINDAAWGLVQVKGKTTALKGTNAGGGDIAIGDNLITENGVRARKAAAATDPIFARALEALAAADGVIDAYILSPWD